MTEDVKIEIIKDTQEILGKIIKKPTLTEKLLKKPPFRFLHDICTSGMRETGFLVGVINGPEDKIENIKDKEGKIAFLQKVIAAVETSNGIKLTVKPNKIVAGLEATKTNEFLQALGKALEKQKLENKNNKTQSIKKVVRHKSKERKEEVQQQEKKQVPQKTSKQVIQNGKTDHREEKKKVIGDNPQISPKKYNSVKSFGENTDEKKIRDKKLKECVLDDENLKNSSKKNEEKNFKEILNGAGESVDLPNIETVTVNGIDGQGDQNLPTKTESLEVNDFKKGHSGRQKHRRSSFHNVGETISTVEKITVKENNENEASVKSMDEKAVIDTLNLEKVNSADKSESIYKEQNKIMPSSPNQNSNFLKKDTNVVKEGTMISRPRTAIRPITARPASARPAAPRIRDRGDIPVEETKMTPGKIQVIEDKETVNEVDDENLVSLETVNDIMLEEADPVAQSIQTFEKTEHGHLVEQILEVQRELEDNSRLTLAEDKLTGKTEIEWDFEKNRDSTNRDIEKLRSCIQNLTRSTNPLGKLLDFFQEDIDTIQRELETWKTKNASLNIQIAHEKSITEQYVEPLKIHLREIQQSIDDQREQISLVKANVIRNNQKIQKLLVGT